MKTSKKLLNFQYIILFLIAIDIFLRTFHAGFFEDLFTFLRKYSSDLALIFTGLVAVGGWFINSYLYEKRQLREEYRKFKAGYLESAFRSISIYSGRSQAIRNIPEAINEGVFKDFEIATKNIMLYGSRKDNELLSEIMEKINQGKNYDFDPLLSNLKNNLREQMGLKKYDGHNYWLVDPNAFGVVEIDVPKGQRNNNANDV